MIDSLTHPGAGKKEEFPYPRDELWATVLQNIFRQAKVSEDVVKQGFCSFHGGIGPSSRSGGKLWRTGLLLLEHR